MNILTEKFLNVLRSVLPIVLLVLLIHFTIVPLTGGLLVSFITGTFFILFGLTIFLVGIDLAITPTGEYMGKGIAWSNKITVVILAGLVLGFFISAAEPSLTVLSNQIGNITEGAISSLLIIVVVSLGIACMVVIGLLRIVYDFSIIPVLTFAYILIFILAFFTSTEFLSISFDASGATTGSVTVPFLLALSTGIAALKKKKKIRKR